MRVLVTGHQGKIGTPLILALIAGGHDARGMDVESGGDILSESSMTGAFDTFHPEVVIHLAAQTSVQDSIEDPWTDLFTNVIGTYKVLRFAKASGSKVIFAGSAGTAYDVKSPYGLSKKTAAEYAAMFQKLYDLDVVILGLSNVYGPGMEGVVGQFIAAEKVSRPGTQNPPGCVIYGDGLQTRDFIYIDDVVEAFASALTWEPGYYEVATAKLSAVWDVFRLLTFEWGYTPKLTYEEALPGEVVASRPLRCDLPWVPVTLEEGLKRTVAHG